MIRLYPLLLLLFFASCQTPCTMKPTFSFTPLPTWAEQLPSAFPPLSPEEWRQDWGKELIIGNHFGSEGDYYRAITSYKRALILIPERAKARRLELEYRIMLSYYLGHKYQEAIDLFEKSPLSDVSTDFPAFNDLLVLLYACYTELGKEERACAILQLMQFSNPETAKRLSLFEQIRRVDFCAVESLADEAACPEAHAFVAAYASQAKSVRKAQVLNAVLPGAGYYYVGQKQSAVTSFVINTLFTAAAYQLFDRGYVAGGLIVSSLELGWYVGGINGAGLEAHEYNERLYETHARELLGQCQLFPVMMLKYSF